MGKINCKSCVDCKDRHIGCHSTCERYISFRKEKDAENARIQEYHMKMQLFNGGFKKKRGTWEVFRET